MTTEVEALIKLYDILLGNYELQPDYHSKQALHEFAQKHPEIANFDANGNCIKRSAV